MVNVYVFDIRSICIHVKELLRQFAFHQKYREWSHFETDVWHIWEFDNRTIRRDLWSEYNLLVWFWKHLSLVGGEKKSSVSSELKGLPILRFCIVLWKDEREAAFKLCMGRQIDVVQKFIRIQDFGQNWWWANGIRVDYLPRIHYIGALQQSPRVLVVIECNTRKLYWTDYLHVDV